MSGLVFGDQVTKNKRKEGAYPLRSEKLEKTIQAITKKYPLCPFHVQRGPNQWTPAHVAVLTGNVACLHFLLSKNAPMDIPDTDGNTPIDLAREHHPELLPMLQKKALFAKILTPICAQFARGAVATDPNTDDFGVCHQEVIFSQVNETARREAERKTHTRKAERRRSSAIVSQEHTDLRLNHLVENMIRVGVMEGFKVVPTDSPFYPRDHFAKTPEGAIFGTAQFDSRDIKGIVEKLNSLACYFPKKWGTFSSTNPFVSGQMMGTAAEQRVDALYNHRTRTDAQELVTSRFLLECGDKFVVTNCRKEKVLLLGAQHLPFIHAQCKLQGLFDDPLISVRPQEHVLPRQLRETAEEMYALGLLEISGRSGFLKPRIVARLQQEAHKQGRTDYRAIGEEIGVIHSLSDQEIASVEAQVKRYLGERNIVLELIRHTFGATAFPISSCAYHLDAVMTPGPNNHMFLYDPITTLHVIEQLLSKQGDFGFTAKDTALLEQYRQTAIQMRDELGPIFARVKDELANAGIRVIPTPGIFYDAPMSEDNPVTSNVHFMNPLTGSSKKNGGTYYITTGTSVGDQLGPVLMDLYAEFLDRHVPGIRVHYIGHDPTNPRDFTQAMQLWNHTKVPPQAGVHCMSYSTETEECKV